MHIETSKYRKNGNFFSTGAKSKRSFLYREMFVVIAENKMSILEFVMMVKPQHKFVLHRNLKQLHENIYAIELR